MDINTNTIKRHPVMNLLQALRSKTIKDKELYKNKGCHTVRGHIIQNNVQWNHSGKLYTCALRGERPYTYATIGPYGHVKVKKYDGIVGENNLRTYGVKDSYFNTKAVNYSNHLPIGDEYALEEIGALAHHTLNELEKYILDYLTNAGFPIIALSTMYNLGTFDHSFNYFNNSFAGALYAWTNAHAPGFTMPVVGDIPYGFIFSQESLSSSVLDEIKTYAYKMRRNAYNDDLLYLIPRKLRGKLEAPKDSQSHTRGYLNQILDGDVYYTDLLTNSLLQDYMLADNNVVATVIPSTGENNYSARAAFPNMHRWTQGLIFRVDQSLVATAASVTNGIAYKAGNILFTCTIMSPSAKRPAGNSYISRHVPLIFQIPTHQYHDIKTLNTANGVCPETPFLNKDYIYLQACPAYDYIIPNSTPVMTLEFEASSIRLFPVKSGNFYRQTRYNDSNMKVVNGIETNVSEVLLHPNIDKNYTSYSQLQTFFGLTGPYISTPFLTNDFFNITRSTALLNTRYGTFLPIIGVSKDGVDLRILDENPFGKETDETKFFQSLLKRLLGNDDNLEDDSLKVPIAIGAGERAREIVMCIQSSISAIQTHGFIIPIYNEIEGPYPNSLAMDEVTIPVHDISEEDKKLLKTEGLLNECISAMSNGAVIIDAGSAATITKKGSKISEELRSKLTEHFGEDHLSSVRPIEDKKIKNK